MRPLWRPHPPPPFMLALAFVVASALGHAYWNFLFKKARGSEFTLGLSRVVQLIFFAPIFAALSLGHWPALIRFWPLIVVAALLTLVYWVFLSEAYKRVDLVLAYPLSRGSILLFLPFLAFAFIGEKLDWLGGLGVSVIALGIFAQQFGAAKGSARIATSLGMAFAIASGLAAAGYSLWDKVSIQKIPSFLYLYCYSGLLAIIYVTWLSARHGPAPMKAEWKLHRNTIVAIGILDVASYALLLLGLQSGKATYVLAVRQLSIAFGVFFAWKLLGEEMTVAKRLGVAAIVLGSIAVSLAK